ncbi:PTS sugar transporter subunit IIA [Bacillus changyiensis]|uniref:PTS sugar transporter subunit IIA n=1 Tax=Bacillus changyiensis TaxID=3004103 RepID=UPI0022E04517|nr:PTS sugar transporter subunit IIA [Bacillus changyiensis]MDA1477860.1 PTS sugar transporter subunit IIA [Bacillus changyiensis]
MRHFVLASHGKFADGILHSLELIKGKHENIRTINAYTNENEDLQTQMNELLEDLDVNDELVVVTDIFGGSINNEFMNLLDDKRIHVIAGLNLPLVIELVTMSKHEKDVVNLIKTALVNSKRSIQYCNAILNNEDADEDF